MVEATETAAPATYDHLRPATATDTSLDPGVYRVVGTPGDRVTLLRVADDDGHRINTGEVHTVASTDLAAFEPAENPDENQSIAAAVASQLQGFWWSLRLMGRAVVERPIPGTAALALVVVGLVGDRFLSIPDSYDTALFLVGVLGLFYLSKSTVD